MKHVYLLLYLKLNLTIVMSVLILNTSVPLMNTGVQITRALVSQHTPRRRRKFSGPGRFKRAA